MGEDVEIIDCDSDEILNSGRLPGHGEDNLARNLQNEAPLDSTEFFLVEYHRRMASFLNPQ